VDDMMSILYFLSCPDIDIKAITIENGISSVDSGAEMALRLLNLTGHPEIPVAKGTVNLLKATMISRFNGNHRLVSLLD